MTKTLPALYSYSIENINKKIQDMINLGYSKQDVIKMTKSLPSLYNLSIEIINKKIQDMINLGYTKQDVIKMTREFPALYSYNIETIKNRIEDMINLGYTRQDVINITKSLPSLLSLSTENIRQKIEFYDSINMHELAIVRPRYLMQSTALSYARYMFYKDKGIIIDMSNYSKLFIGQKQFEKSYGITKKELLEKYNYEEYLEAKKNGRTL